MLALHASQEHAIPIQSLHHQASSNAPTHTGRREDREISGKYVYSIAIGTNRSNWGAKVRPPRATAVVSSPTFVKWINHFRNGSCCPNLIYPHMQQWRQIGGPTSHTRGEWRLRGWHRQSTCPDTRAYFGAFSQQIITPYFWNKMRFG